MWWINLLSKSFFHARSPWPQVSIGVRASSGSVFRQHAKLITSYELVFMYFISVRYVYVRVLLLCAHNELKEESALLLWSSADRCLLHYCSSNYMFAQPWHHTMGDLFGQMVLVRRQKNTASSLFWWTNCIRVNSIHYLWDYRSECVFVSKCVSQKNLYHHKK